MHLRWIETDPHLGVPCHDDIDIGKKVFSFSAVVKTCKTAIGYDTIAWIICP